MAGELGKGLAGKMGELAGKLVAGQSNKEIPKTGPLKDLQDRTSVPLHSKGTIISEDRRKRELEGRRTRAEGRSEREAARTATTSTPEPPTTVNEPEYFAPAESATVATPFDYEANPPDGGWERYNAIVFGDKAYSFNSNIGYREYVGPNRFGPPVEDDTLFASLEATRIAQEQWERQNAAQPIEDQDVVLTGDSGRAPRFGNQRILHELGRGASSGLSKVTEVSGGLWDRLKKSWSEGAPKKEVRQIELAAQGGELYVLRLPGEARRFHDHFLLSTKSGDAGNSISETSLYESLKHAYERQSPEAKRVAKELKSFDKDMGKAAKRGVLGISEAWRKTFDRNTQMAIDEQLEELRLQREGLEQRLIQAMPQIIFFETDVRNPGIQIPEGVQIAELDKGIQIIPEGGQAPRGAESRTRPASEMLEARRQEITDIEEPLQQIMSLLDQAAKDKGLRPHIEKSLSKIKELGLQTPSYAPEGEESVPEIGAASSEVFRVIELALPAILRGSRLDELNQIVDRYSAGRGQEQERFNAYNKILKQMKTKPAPQGEVNVYDSGRLAVVAKRVQKEFLLDAGLSVEAIDAMDLNNPGTFNRLVVNDKIRSMDLRFASNAANPEVIAAGEVENLVDIFDKAQGPVLVLVDDPTKDSVFAHYNVKLPQSGLVGKVRKAARALSS